MKRATYTLLVWAILGVAHGVDEADLLPVEDAFAVSARVLDTAVLEVSWDIAEGYYMYRGRISFNSLTPGVEVGAPVLPRGEEKEDEFFGRVETYRHRVVATMPLLRADPSLREFELEARSQGCADLGVCYPPQRQRLDIALPPLAAAPVAGFSRELGGGLFTGAQVPGLLGDDALPEDQAFRFEAIALSGDRVLARWTIAPGYYLYRDKIRFEVAPDAPVQLGAPQLPAGVDMTDEHFGAVKVYYDQVEVPLPIRRLARAAGALQLTGHYQGCKEAGICYPPIVRTLALDLPTWNGALATTVAAGGAMVASPAANMPVPEQDRLAAALGEDTWWTLLSFLGFGLLLAFTPCVFPMIPILSGIIAGQGENLSTRKAFSLSAIYVLAMALTYTVAGVVAGLFGKNLQAAFQNFWVLAGFSAVFVLLALSMFGFYELQLPASVQNRLNRISNRQQAGTWLGVAVMGVLSALIVGPCVAPPLAAALIYIGQTQDPLLGGLALFVLSLGMGAPLLVVGASAGRILPKAGAWMDTIKAVFGVALLALAIWMLERIAPPTLILFLWGGLAVASGVYMGALERLEVGVSGWRKLWKSLGLILLILGVLELIGALTGGRDWMRPLAHVRSVSGASGATEVVVFQKIKSLQQLQSALAAADRPAMLDFYADWCVDCKRMDKYTFPEAPVQAVLRAGLVFKADVTANDDVDQTLMRALRIIGPPAILFFDRHGRELPAYRVVGYQKPEVFAAHVEAAFAAGQ